MQKLPLKLHWITQSPISKIDNSELTIFIFKVQVNRAKVPGMTTYRHPVTDPRKSAIIVYFIIVFIF